MRAKRQTSLNISVVSSKPLMPVCTVSVESEFVFFLQQKFSLMSNYFGTNTMSRDMKFP